MHNIYSTHFFFSSQKVQNVPIPMIVPEEMEDALVGGEGVVEYVSYAAKRYVHHKFPSLVWLLQLNIIVNMLQGSLSYYYLSL